MMFLVEATALKRSSLRADPNHRPLGTDPHLQRVLLHIDLLDQELDDPRLLASTEGRMRSCGAVPAAANGSRVIQLAATPDLKADSEAVHNSAPSKGVKLAVSQRR
jgi:hypothetical protein